MAKLLDAYYFSKKIKELKSKINTFIFDYDGVFTNNIVTIDADGNMLRTANLRDGYAVKKLVEEGYNVAIISGAHQKALKKRFEQLGVTDVFLNIKDKLSVLEKYMESKNLKFENICYMGDDYPDLPVLKEVGLAIIPQDATISMSVRVRTKRKGGEGCVRELIEEFIKLN